MIYMRTGVSALTPTLIDFLWGTVSMEPSPIVTPAVCKMDQNHITKSPEGQYRPWPQGVWLDVKRRLKIANKCLHHVVFWPIIIRSFGPK